MKNPTHQFRTVDKPAFVHLDPFLHRAMPQHPTQFLGDPKLRRVSIGRFRAAAAAATGSSTAAALALPFGSGLCSAFV